MRSLNSSCLLERLTTEGYSSSRNTHNSTSSPGTNQSPLRRAPEAERLIKPVSASHQRAAHRTHAATFRSQIEVRGAAAVHRR